MNILITGGAGFIGSHIADAYLVQGHTVTVIDNLVTGRRANINPRVAFHHADIRDADAVERILSGANVDLVNHHAAQMDVRRSVDDPVYDASVNVIGMLTVLEACRRHGVGRVIFASSGGAIYGEQDYFPADELHPTRPISPYGVAKLTTEQYLHYYHVVHGIDAVCLRYANVYGPRQNPEGEAGVIAIFATRMLAGQKPVINGPGTQTRDYVHVRDVVQANVLALGVSGSHVLNVGTGRETDVNHLFHTINRLTGSRTEEAHGPAKAGEQLRSVLDAQRLATLLGWKQGVTLEEGLEGTVNYFRSAS